jgi:hypothetical protein
VIKAPLGSIKLESTAENLLDNLKRRGIAEKAAALAQ